MCRVLLCPRLPTRAHRNVYKHFTRPTLKKGLEHRPYDMYASPTHQTGTMAREDASRVTNKKGAWGSSLSTTGRRPPRAFNNRLYRVVFGIGSVVCPVYTLCLPTLHEHPSLYSHAYGRTSPKS